MATISSLGVGTNGLDSEAIVTKLVELEKQSLTTLKAKATIEQAKISSFGKIQSQFSALSDVATRILAAASWSSRVATSSNTSAASITATASTTATSFTLDVDALAKEQSNSSAAVALGSAVGAGTLTFRTGTWSGGSANADIAAADALVVSTAAASTAATNTANSASANAVSTAATAASALADDNTAASDLASAAVSPEQATYASAYSDWVAAISANDHSTPALQAAEAAALAAKNNAYAAMTGGEQSAADGITATADATDASALKGDALSAAATSVAAAAAAAAASVAAAAAVAAANVARPTFTAGSGSDVAIAVTASDTVTTLAAKINAANAGVIATVFRDGTGERLLLRSKSTGADAGFRVQTADVDSNNTDNAGLSRFSYDPQTAAFGMASSGIPVQNGQDAKARINGLEVTSKTNTLTDNIPGVTITLTATTTTNYGTVSEVKAPITMAVREDVTPAVKNVQDFVAAYNALAASLSDMTKYDAATKTPSIFQGDSAVIGLQSILRNVLGSVSTGSAYQRLSDVGIERQLDGSLTLNTTKLSAAANNGTELQKLFTANNNNSQTNGFAQKFSDLAKGVLGTGGSVVNKAKALQKSLDTNATEQTRVNDRAAAVEARLRKQYTALDTKMASLTALNAYVAQQVATWNKSTS